MKYIKNLFWALPLLLLSCGVLRVKQDPSTSPKETTPSGTITLVSVNDMHAAIDQFPRFAYMVDSLRGLYPDLLLLSAGDNQTGHAANDQYDPKGLPMIELMNAVGFDYSAFGNHEFDLGQKHFAFLAKQAHFPFLAANVYPSPDEPMPLSPCRVHVLDNGLKIGILGLLQLEPNGIPSCHPARTFGVLFEHAFVVAPRYKKLADSTHLVIGLTHLGQEDDVKLIQQEPWIDIILGGHSHELISPPRDFPREGRIPSRVVQQKNKLKYMTVTQVEIKEGKPISMVSTILTIDPKAGASDPEVTKMADAYNNSPTLREEIATATAPFPTELSLGYLMCDAYRYAAEADIALQNNGGIRLSSMPAGPITVRDVFILDPFGNELLTVYLKPKELRALLSFAWVKEEFQPLRASGIRAVYHVDGKDLLNVEVYDENGAPLDEEHYYKVAYSSYLEAAYPYERSEKVANILGFTSAEAIMRYLRFCSQVKDYGHLPMREFIMPRK